VSRSNVASSEANLIALRDELVRRLESGDAQITEAKVQGTDTSRWENHWITLLREYEGVCKVLQSRVGSEVAVAA
jgi:hypothetical protein